MNGKLHVSFLIQQIKIAGKEKLRKIKNHLTGENLQNFPEIDIPNQKIGMIIKLINDRLSDLKKSNNKKRIREVINNILNAENSKEHEKQIRELAKLFKEILQLRVMYNSKEPNAGNIAFIKTQRLYKQTD